VPDGGILLKYVHILAAMVYVTGYIGGAILQNASARATDWPVRRALLRYSNVLTNGLLVPGFVAAGVLGIAAALVLGYPLLSGWVRNALVLYVIILITGLVYWSPQGRKQQAALDAGDEAAFTALARRPSIRYVGLFDGIIILALIYLMVVKPA